MTTLTYEEAKTDDHLSMDHISSQHNMRKFNILLKVHPETFEPVMYVDIIGEGGGIGHYKFSMSLSSQVYHRFESDKGMQRLNIIEGLIWKNDLMELTQDEKDALINNKENMFAHEES